MSPREDEKKAGSRAAAEPNRALRSVQETDQRRAVIAARLKAARQMAGLSQAQIARLMGLHRPSISEAEAGRRRVSAEELAELSRHYGVSVTWLSGVGPETVDAKDARVELAARELTKLKTQDLDRVLQLLAALRAPADPTP